MRRYTSVILVAVLLLSALSGIWLIAQPSFERQANHDAQENLLAEIEDSMARPAPVPTPVLTPKPETTVQPDNIRYIPLEPEEKEPVPIGTQLGILSIESLDMKLPIVEGITAELLKTSTGHVPETAAIGDIGNAVIAGHRNYDYGSMFNRLGEAEIGDIIDYTSADGESCLFEVFEITVIEPSDQIAFIQPADKSIITLYTCTPIREATHRLLVRAEKNCEEAYT